MVAKNGGVLSINENPGSLYSREVDLTKGKEYRGK